MNDPYRIADTPAGPEPASTAAPRPPSGSPVRIAFWVLLGALVAANAALSMARRPILAMIAGIAVVIVVGVAVLRHLTGSRR